jgi:hypothetical protein
MALPWGASYFKIFTGGTAFINIRVDQYQKKGEKKLENSRSSYIYKNERAG